MDPKAGPMIPAETDPIMIVSSETRIVGATETGLMMTIETKAIIRNQITNGTGQQNAAKACLMEMNAVRQAINKTGEVNMIPQCLTMTATGVTHVRVMVTMTRGVASEAVMVME